MSLTRLYAGNGSQRRVDMPGIIPVVGWPTAATMMTIVVLNTHREWH